MTDMLKGWRYKIFGQATNEDIKELVLGFVLATGTMIGMIIGLNVIDILE